MVWELLPQLYFYTEVPGANSCSADVEIPKSPLIKGVVWERGRLSLLGIHIPIREAREDYFEIADLLGYGLLRMTEFISDNVP